MSTLKTNAAQIGQSVTATNNFTLYQPTTPDGTVRLGVGNAGSVTDILTMNSSGKIGIGQIPGGKRVTITDSVSATASFDAACILQLYNSNTDFSGSNYNQVGIAFGNSSSRSAIISGTFGNDYLDFYTNGDFTTRRMRLGADGKIYIGNQTNTRPTSSNIQGLTLDPVAGGFSICASSTQTPFELNLKGTTGNIANFYKDGVTVGTIAVSGTNTAYNTSSDYRLKENIKPMENALATVLMLNPVTYNWKVDGSSGRGFIAHELQEIVPECVTGEKDAVEIVEVKDDEGNVIETTERPLYQGIDVSFLVGILTKAIQEQQDIIDSLKSRLEAAGL